MKSSSKACQGNPGHAFWDKTHSLLGSFRREHPAQRSPLRWFRFERDDVYLSHLKNARELASDPALGKCARNVVNPNALNPNSLLKHSRAELLASRHEPIALDERHENISCAAGCSGRLRSIDGFLAGKRF
jgi:hypothetical protein